MPRAISTVLVTGASGYLGGRLAASLAARGFQVRRAMRRPQASTDVPYDLAQPCSPTLFQGIDAIVHAAYDFSARTGREIEQVNVTGSRRLLAAAAEAGVPKIIFISSISAFAGCRSLYGRAKLAVEETAPPGALIIRPGLTYGDGAGGMFGKLRASAGKDGRVPLLWGSPCSQYLLHEDDLAEAIARWLSGAWANAPRCVTLAHPRPWPLEELLKEMARRQQRPLRFLRLPWPLVWLALRTFESVGLKLGYKSDSIISTVYQNPAPDFSEVTSGAVAVRPFA